MTAGTPAVALIALLLTLGGGAAGALWTWTTRASSATEQAGGDQERAALLREQRALREALEALTTELRSRPLSAGNPLGQPLRDPVVEEAAGEGSGPAADDLAPVAGTQSATRWPSVGLSDAVAKPTADQRLQMLNVARGAVDGRPEQHLFASYREILQRFGRPDEINGDSSMRWYYVDPHSGKTVQLVFCEGVLIAVYD